MKLIKARNVLFVFLITFGVILNQHAAEADLVTLFFIIPYLMLKSGLAAPVILAVMAKLAILFGIPLFLPLLATSGITTGTTSYGIPGVKLSDDNLGRIKRSTDFMEGILGKVEFDETKLLEKILSLDTRKCGERLLCELAAAEAKKEISKEEYEIVSLFGTPEGAEQPNPHTAKGIYAGAIKIGQQKQDCGTQYPTCPYSKSRMMQLISIVNNVHINRPQQAYSPNHKIEILVNQQQ